MMKNRTAILCASGIGDALLMMTAYASCKKAGHDVVLMHEKGALIQPLFPDAQIVPFSDDLSKFNLIILENDNSKRAWDLFRKRERGLLPNLVVFFPTPSKMALPCDFIFKKGVPILNQIVAALSDLLGSASKDNEIVCEGEKKHSKRVTIHPTSADPKRNWSQKKFYRLAKKIKERGFDPCFAMAKNETTRWENAPFPVHAFDNLSDLAKHLKSSAFFIGNDSGLGHLASNLGVSTLTISGNPKRVALWRPAWSPGLVATQKTALPNFKGVGLSIRDNFWQKAVSVRSVLGQFTLQSEGL